MFICKRENIEVIGENIVFEGKKFCQHVPKPEIVKKDTGYYKASQLGVKSIDD